MLQPKNNLWPNKRLRRKRFPLWEGATHPGVSCRVCSQWQPLHFQPGGKRKHRPDCRIISPLWVQRNETGSWLFLQTTNDWQTADGLLYPLPTPLSNQHLSSIPSTYWGTNSADLGVSSSGHYCPPRPRDWAKKMNLACRSLISVPDTPNVVANLLSLLPDVVSCRQMFIILNSYRRLADYFSSVMKLREPFGGLPSDFDNHQAPFIKIILVSSNMQTRKWEDQSLSYVKAHPNCSQTHPLRCELHFVSQMIFTLSGFTWQDSTHSQTIFGITSQGSCIARILTSKSRSSLLPVSNGKHFNLS